MDCDLASETDTRVSRPRRSGHRSCYSLICSILTLTYNVRADGLTVRAKERRYEPKGAPELIAEGIHAVDDFCLDERSGVAYITTHIDNTIHRVPLQPGRGPESAIVAGDPFTDSLVGPSSIVWGRTPGDYGRVAYVTTDGGHAKPPADGIVRPAQVVRLALGDKTVSSA